ncbi:MAG: Rho termination factor N-terminal domain-containing protein, partial [Actinomycetota bacterium]
MAAPQLGRTQLEEKDRDDLAQIASALGLKGVAKASKAVLIEKILEETMSPEPQES